MDSKDVNTSKAFQWPDCFNLLFTTAGFMVGAVEGLWLLSLTMPAVLLTPRTKEGIEMRSADERFRTTETDGEISEYFSAAEGGTRPDIPSFKGTIGTEPSKIEDICIKGNEEGSVPTILDVESLYELGGWMRAQTYKRKKVSK